MSSKKASDAVKLVLVGDSGVGKTCIISRYVFGEYNNNTNSTDGASYAMKRLDLPKLRTSINLDIWDTAGQEKYKSLTKFFYKEAGIIIMVYDITKKKTFENLKTYWYQEVEDSRDQNIILSIVGNKSDLYDNEEVQEKEAREYAESINAIFGLTSAQNNIGIDQLFEEIGIKYLNKNFHQKVGENYTEKPSIQLNQEQIKKHDKEHKRRKKFC